MCLVDIDVRDFAFENVYSDCMCWAGCLRGDFEACHGMPQGGKNHFKNKICQACQSNGVLISTERIRAIFPEQHEMFTNQVSVGVWSSVIMKNGISVCFRTVNQTSKCKGRRIVIFKTLPPDDIEWAPLPPQSTLLFRSAMGTLVPQFDQAPPEPSVEAGASHDVIARMLQTLATTKKEILVNISKARLNSVQFDALSSLITALDRSAAALTDVVSHPPSPPGTGERAVGSWSSGLCGCLADPYNSALVFFCWPIVAGRLGEKVVGARNVGLCFTIPMLLFLLINNFCNFYRMQVILNPAFPKPISDNDRTLLNGAPSAESPPFLSDTATYPFHRTPNHGR